MKLPRDLSGADLVKCLCRGAQGVSPVYCCLLLWFRSAGCEKVDQSPHGRDGHAPLFRCKVQFQRIPVPNHTFLRIGTLNSILRLVSTHKGVSREDILDSLND